MTPYYDEGGITIYRGDCQDVMKTLEKVNHIITDPPYEAEAHTLGRRAGTRNGGSEARPLDFAPITSDTRQIVGQQMSHLSTGWILVFCQVEAAMLWRDALVPARYMRTRTWE